MNFKQKTVVLTGATGGIGKVLCQQLIEQGAIVFACGRSAQKLDALSKELTAKSSSCTLHPITMDMSSNQSVADGAAKILAKTDRVDVLINNAGFTNFGEKQRSQSVDGFDVIDAINVIGPALLTELLVPVMKGGDMSRVLNISSTAVMKFMNPDKKVQLIEEVDASAEDKRSILDMYAESKMAIAMYSVGRAIELRSIGIFMNPLILRDVEFEDGKDKDWSFGVKLINTIISPFKLKREKAVQLYLDCIDKQEEPDFYDAPISSAVKVAKLPKYGADIRNQAKLVEVIRKIAEPYAEQLAKNSQTEPA